MKVCENYFNLPSLISDVCCGCCNELLSNGEGMEDFERFCGPPTRCDVINGPAG